MFFQIDEGFYKKKLKLSPKIWGREKLYWLLIMPDKMWIWRMKRSGIKWNEPEIISNEVFFGGRYILLKYLTYKYVKVCTVRRQKNRIRTIKKSKTSEFWILHHPSILYSFMFLEIWKKFKIIFSFLKLSFLSFAYFFRFISF